jgi:acetyltransferase-like isoleucine patch superfamily enzyme
VGGGAEIGHRCLLGLNSTVGNKVKVGNNSIVGAGTLVTKSIKDNSVIVRGNDVLLDWPAQEFLQLTDFDDVS